MKKFNDADIDSVTKWASICFPVILIVAIVVIAGPLFLVTVYVPFNLRCDTVVCYIVTNVSLTAGLICVCLCGCCCASNACGVAIGYAIVDHYLIDHDTPVINEV